MAGKVAIFDLANSFNLLILLLEYIQNIGLSVATNNILCGTPLNALPSAAPQLT